MALESETIDLNSRTEVVYDLEGGRILLSGCCYEFEAAQLLDHSHSIGVGLHDLLLCQVVAGLWDSPRSYEVIVFYEVAEQALRIGFCSRRKFVAIFSKAIHHRLSALPGYVNCGDGRVALEAACPLILWMPPCTMSALWPPKHYEAGAAHDSSGATPSDVDDARSISAPGEVSSSFALDGRSYHHLNRLADLKTVPLATYAAERARRKAEWLEDHGNAVLGVTRSECKPIEAALPELYPEADLGRPGVWGVLPLACGAIAARFGHTMRDVTAGLSEYTMYMKWLLKKQDPDVLAMNFASLLGKWAADPARRAEIAGQLARMMGEPRLAQITSEMWDCLVTYFSVGRALNNPPEADKGELLSVTKWAEAKPHRWVRLLFAVGAWNGGFALQLATALPGLHEGAKRDRLQELYEHYD